MNVLTGLVDQIVSWINRLFGFGDFFTFRYSQYIVYAVMLFILSKILKVKLDIKSGRG